MKKTQPYWFKRRRYGYGWFPVTWQGWLSVGIAVLLIAGAVMSLLVLPRGPLVLGGYIAAVALIVVGILIVGAKKGPKPKWRWGRKPDDDPKLDL